MSRITLSVAFEAQHPDALAVYCSDGRFTEAVEALLHGLGFPRLDTLTIPGGAALLDHTSASLSGMDAIRQGTSFLITGHKIKHAVLIAHQSCGYYKARLPYDSEESMLRRQLGDLRSADRWLRNDHPGVMVSKYYAWHVANGVEFELVE